MQQVFCSELQVSKHFPARMLRIYIQRQQQLYFCAKDCVLNVVSNIQENAQDIYAGAQQINDERAAAEDAAEAEGQDEAAETVAEEETKTEEKAE